MPGKIAVDQKLANVRQRLEERGYQTTNLKQGVTGAEVIVVSGTDSNVLGDESIVFDVPVIEAAGLTADEVLDEVERYLQVKR